MLSKSLSRNKIKVEPKISSLRAGSRLGTKNTWHNILEYSTLHSHQHKNLKSHKKTFYMQDRIKYLQLKCEDRTYTISISFWWYISTA